MRWTKTLIPTLRESPADAETISHKLMTRAGLIRKLTSGVYSYLPLGLAVLHKVTDIVREEMNRSGAQELMMPILHPVELWQETGRYETFGPLMCQFKDRYDRVNILGPTHEEVITHIVRNEINSYKQLPITLYQIQTKFRDEVRPRFGAIRSREFIMKDAYSFDIDVEGMNKSYQNQYETYKRIFSRCGLDYIIVEADTGLMGGDVSHEFIVPCPSGEGICVACKSCGYSASAEQAECRTSPAYPAEAQPPVSEVPTPGKSTIEHVTQFLGVDAKKLIKTLILKADGKPVAALVRGDHELNPSKLGRLLKSECLEMASPEYIQQVTGGPIGFSGPVGLKARIVADNCLKGLTNAVVGANRRDAHLKNVNVPRDFEPSEWADIRITCQGDLCPRCQSPLTFSNGVEVGQVFKLGTKYSSKMKALYQDEKGNSHPMVMGCYGIGVNRIVATAIESSHDDNGIIWPMSIAPYKAIVVSVNSADAKISAISEEIHDMLNGMGVETLWDDRDLSAGVKFKDADMIGIPVRITVGAKTLKEGTVDVKLRNAKDQTAVSVNAVQEGVRHAIENYRP